MKTSRLVALVAAPLALAASFGTASPALAGCATATYMDTPTSGASSRVAQYARTFQNASSSTTTFTTSVTSQRTVTAAFSGSVTTTSTMNNQLWAAARSRASASYGSTYTAVTSDTNPTGSSYTASVPAGQTWTFSYGVPRVFATGRVYRDNADCTTTYLGAKTLTAPVNVHQWWTARVS